MYCYIFNHLFRYIGFICNSCTGTPYRPYPSVVPSTVPSEDPSVSSSPSSEPPYPPSLPFPGFITWDTWKGAGDASDATKRQETRRIAAKTKDFCMVDRKWNKHKHNFGLTPM